MKQQLLMTLGIACLPVLALAAPDFSGTWMRDNAKSDAVPNHMYWLTRGVDGGAGRGPGGSEVQITVTQNAAGLTVSDPQKPLRQYALDGKPHEQTADTGMVKVSVNASLQGDTLVVATTQPYGGMPGNATLQVRETWSLSPDGKSLTVTTTRDSPAAKQAYKEIYSRK
jgi:hypothetical protein